MTPGQYRVFKHNVELLTAQVETVKQQVKALTLQVGEEKDAQLKEKLAAFLVRREAFLTYITDKETYAINKFKTLPAPVAG